ncbi:MAG: hypothetical protein XD63_0202 [Thermoanaerobacterales bacterium 50_218]|nr:MAG: hypothetical protein XD63_0202 [Thermoanaerobacterales bacterium 50_218]HAA90394.1 hypothetical protein [Peptococcaceae bacterium]
MPENKNQEATRKGLRDVFSPLSRLDIETGKEIEPEKKEKRRRDMEIAQEYGPVRDTGRRLKPQVERNEAQPKENKQQ